VFAATQPRRSLDFFSGLTPVPCPLSLNSFICHTSENLSVSPDIATLPKTCVSKPTVCQTSEPPGGPCASSTFGRSDRPVDVPTCFRAIPCIIRVLCTLWHSTKTQLPCFQAIPHSLYQNRGVGEREQQGYGPGRTKKCQGCARSKVSGIPPAAQSSSGISKEEL
jgi:hypothetical protein